MVKSSLGKFDLECYPQSIGKKKINNFLHALACEAELDAAHQRSMLILQIGSEIIPVEVKAATDLRAKSLSVYRRKFNPSIEIRTSLADYKKTDNLFDIPLYALKNLKEIIGVLLKLQFQKNFHR